MKRHQFSPSTRRGGLLIRLLLAMGGLFLLALIAWVLLLPSVLVSTIRSRTGFTVKIEHLSVNPLTARVEIDGLLLENPEGWPEKNFVDLRRFRAEAELFSLLSDRWVIDDAVVDVARLTLVTGTQGTTNVMLFRDGLAGKSKETAASQPVAQTGKKQGFLIRHLLLKCDQLVYADYSGGRSLVKTYNLNLNRDLRDVDSVAKIISPVTGSALGVLANALGGLSKTKPDVLLNAVDSLQAAGRKTGETLKNLFRSLENKKP